MGLALRGAAGLGALLAAIAATLGCGAATPEAKYGTTARYSPQYRGYIVSRWDNDAAAPSPSAGVLVLRNPLTDEKVRCREELATWLDPGARSTDADVRSDFDFKRSLVIMAPFTAVALGVGAPFLGLALVPHAIAGYPSSTSFYDLGIDAFRFGRYDEARQKLEMSILTEPYRNASRSRALYYLGLSYEQLHRDDLARQALTEFVRRAGVADAAAFQVAEDRLARLGAPIPPCEPGGPVTVVWPR